MNVGAVIGFYEDMKERHELLEHIMRPECGFNERQGGVWTWTFQQNPLTRAVERPSGSAVEIAAVLGFPFIRLRAALPEELFAGSVAQSLGRKDGMSATGLVAAREENLEVMQMLKRGLSCFNCRPTEKKIPDFEEASGGDEKAPAWDTKHTPVRAESLIARDVLMLPPVGSHMLDYDDHIKSSETLEWMTHEPDPTDMVGSALIYAFMANQKVLPVVALSEKVTSATEHFGELRVPGIDHSFTDLLHKFQVMLGPDAGTLTARGKWMQTARLWRFLLLQREDGCWDLTDSLAFALEAHEGRRPPKKEKGQLKGFQALLSLFSGEGDLDDNLDDAADDYMSSDGACRCAARVPSRRGTLTCCRAQTTSSRPRLRSTSVRRSTTRTAPSRSVPPRRGAAYRCRCWSSAGSTTDTGSAS